MPAQKTSQARVLREALSNAEEAESAASEAAYAIREALGLIDAKAEEGLLADLRGLIRELRVGSMFAPTVPDDFRLRLEDILRSAGFEPLTTKDA